MSTMIFSDYARHINGSLYTCDIETQYINNAKKFCKENKEFITFIIDDSVNFLKNFKKSIDFLYLDSLDWQFNDASTHQLKEIEFAIKNLKKDSLVLLDDKGSKTNLSIDFMIENNFRIINETREQVLLTYDGNWLYNIYWILYFLRIFCFKSISGIFITISIKIILKISL